MQNSSSANDHRAMLVLSTYPDRGSATEAARSLLERRWIACASLGSPVTSIYSWKDQVCEDQEFTLTLKTTAARADAIGAFIKQHHPYELPEILFVPVDGDPAFLEWIEQCVSLES